MGSMWYKIGSIKYQESNTTFQNQRNLKVNCIDYRTQSTKIIHSSLHNSHAQKCLIAPCKAQRIVYLYQESRSPYNYLPLQKVSFFLTYMFFPMLTLSSSFVGMSGIGPMSTLQQYSKVHLKKPLNFLEMHNVLQSIWIYVKQQEYKSKDPKDVTCLLRSKINLT